MLGPLYHIGTPSAKVCVSAIGGSKPLGVAPSLPLGGGLTSILRWPDEPLPRGLGADIPEDPVADFLATCPSDEADKVVDHLRLEEIARLAAMAASYWTSIQLAADRGDIHLLALHSAQVTAVTREALGLVRELAQQDQLKDSANKDGAARSTTCAVYHNCAAQFNTNRIGPGPCRSQRLTYLFSTRNVRLWAEPAHRA